MSLSLNVLRPDDGHHAIIDVFYDEAGALSITCGRVVGLQLRNCRLQFETGVSDLLLSAPPHVVYIEIGLRLTGVLYVPSAVAFDNPAHPATRLAYANRCEVTCLANAVLHPTASTCGQSLIHRGPSHKAFSPQSSVSSLSHY